jgi:hypothetical protein
VGREKDQSQPALCKARLMGSALADEAYGNHPANSSAESPG